MSRVAIVILNWNGQKFLQEFLPSVIEHSDVQDTEIFIADNCSDDGSVEFVRQKYPGVKMIRFDRNYGFAGGYNKALKRIESEYFVLLNTDVQVTSGWLSPLINEMDQDKNIAACMPKIRAFRQQDSFEYAGAAGGFIDTFGYPFCRGRILNQIEKDTGQYDENMRIFWASGACLAIRSSAYSEAGGLDSTFFAHMEEIDLCWRLHRLGYSVNCIPGSIVYHVGGGSLPNNNPRKIYLNYRNNLYLLLKNLPVQQMIPVLAIRMIWDVLSAMIYLFNGSGNFTTAVFKAHLDFYRNIPVLLKKRRLHKSVSGIPPAETVRIREIYTGSIVFDFFFRRKRTFSELKFGNCLRKRHK
ncbi:MAG: glycosyltransferase family 2 protein [Bacteroidales bacterium]|nr:glycosyltransferase family 2 protein [Bacteroidales bacterium]